MRRKEMAMDCAQFEEQVHELERPGTEGFVRRRSALAHAESCERCGVLLDKVMSLDFALDSLAVQGSDEQAPARVEAALLAEFRRQHAQAARPVRNYRLAAALAMAAALALAVGITAPRWMPVSPSQAEQNAGVGVAQTVTTEHNAESAGESGGALGNVSTDDSEYATNFVSLPYADDPGTLEDATVVRVTLSRAALASFGVPVADMGSAEQIPADIALSEDGVPQAIRLVANADLDQEN
jgi:hypothetical protein